MIVENLSDFNTQCPPLAERLAAHVQTADASMDGALIEVCLVVNIDDSFETVVSAIQHFHKAGANVTVVNVGEHTLAKRFEKRKDLIGAVWAIDLAEHLGIALHSDIAATGFHVYQFLRALRLDAICFFVSARCAYGCLEAKRMGLAFQGTACIVFVDRLFEWTAFKDCRLPESVADLKICEHEKTAVRMADSVCTDDPFLLLWSQVRRYPGSERLQLVPKLDPTAPSVWFTGESAERNVVLWVNPLDDAGFLSLCRFAEGTKCLADVHVTIVLYGTMSATPAFADAFSHIGAHCRSCEIRLYDHNGFVCSSGDHYFTFPAFDWPLLRSLGRHGQRFSILGASGSYIKMFDCVAPVLALRANALPDAASSEGIWTLDAALEGAETAFQLVARACREGTLELGSGAQRAATARRTPPGDFFMRRTMAGLNSRSASADTAPTVSVVMPTYNRTDILLEALWSLSQQTMKDFEVLLIDDGTTEPDSVSLIDRLERDGFPDLQLRIVRQQNSGPAMARNNGASMAQASLLLFMDDDNIAFPEMIDTMVQAIEHAGLEVACTVPALHARSDRWIESTISVYRAPGPPNAVKLGWVPDGPMPLLGLFYNAFGDNHAIYRKETFERLNGFRGTRHFVYEDYDMFARAVLSRRKVGLVPEILYCYRAHAGSRSQARLLMESALWASRSYTEFFDEETLQSLFAYLKSGLVTGHVNRLDRDIDKRTLASMGGLIRHYKDEEQSELASKLLHAVAEVDIWRGGFEHIAEK